MGVAAFFQTDRTEHRLGEPISVTLSIKNENDHDIYLFVPRGRAGGLQIKIKQGKGQVKDLLEEPEPGLVAEQKLAPGDTYSQQFPLGEWLIINEPGNFIVECSIEIETSNMSLRENERRATDTISVSTELHFTVLSGTR